MLLSFKHVTKLYSFFSSSSPSGSLGEEFEIFSSAFFKSSIIFSESCFKSDDNWLFFFFLSFSISLGVLLDLDLFDDGELELEEFSFLVSF